VKRLLHLLIPVVALGLVASGCAYGGSLTSTGALTVDGNAILSVDELTGELDYLRANPQAAQAVVGSAPAGDDWDQTAAATLLTLHALSELLVITAASEGVEVTAEDEAVAESAIAQALGSSADMPESLTAALVQLVQYQSALQADLEANTAEISDEEIRRAYDGIVADADRFATYACSSHILASFGTSPSTSGPSEPTAEQEAEARAAIDAAAARLAAGEDFAAVARELSDDPGSAARDGDLGCNMEGQFVPEFEAALYALEPGEVSEPVRTQFGYHLILLRSIGVPSFDDISDDIRAELEQRRSDPSAALFALLGEATANVRVEVNPRFGTWDAERLAVVPPEGAAPAPTIAPNPSGLESLLGE
jgi:hypothetical protein